MRKILAAALVMALATSAQAGGNTTNQTAQGIMVNLKTSGTFAIDTTNIYRFDQGVAAGYFSNAWNGVAPVVTCSGSACNGDLCGVPDAPAAPAANPAQVANPGGSAVADKSRCTFLDGGTLTLTDTYTQAASLPTSCTVTNAKTGKLESKSATYTFTFTYRVAPIGETATVAAFTAWPLDQVNDAGLAHVNLDADIAGESVLSKSGVTKFSFSMLDNAGVNRVQNLAVTLGDALGGVVVVAAAAPSDVYFPVDFQYTTNAGSNGVTSLLANGDARTILDSDGFAGNDNGGADGSALALVRMQTVGIDVGVGDFTIGLSGSVKDNAASTSTAFNVLQNLTIVTPGCGNAP